MSIPDDSAVLRRLNNTSREIVSVQTQLASLRAKRDDAIRDAVDQGATERQAAAAAGVGAGYAHLAAKNGRFARVVARERSASRSI